MIDTDKNSPTFNSYAGINDLKNYASARHFILPDDNGLEALLIVSMDFLESQKWLGKRADNNQQLSFPRSGLLYDGVPIPRDEIPKQLIQAQCRLAIESMDHELQPTIGAEIISERIEGVIDVKYAQGTNNGMKRFPWLNDLLAGLLDVSDGFAINTFAMR
ncbi:Uncharacterised protein [Providencia rustigianii]|uniref:Putative DnaT-like domain-containing protein n=1 Tax=Providencia rustigianii TaxID=158850 RepID=A0A379G5R0_9GAMM|nr:DnaT-like ssDNA-binding protein [Providencia rustigianii]SUC36202.1 Uncharacterised protein [Providencia rustigianii]